MSELLARNWEKVLKHPQKGIQPPKTKAKESPDSNLQNHVYRHRHWRSSIDRNLPRSRGHHEAPGATREQFRIRMTSFI